jgi:hypothetical protein
MRRTISIGAVMALTWACGDDGRSPRGGEDAGTGSDGAPPVDAPPAIDAPATPDASTAGDAGTPAPLMLALTLHLENAEPYDDAYFAALRTFAATFESHGARLTLEPRDVVVTAAASRTDFAALESAGHAFGSHAAIGGTMMTSETMLEAQARMRRTQLLGVVERVDHISGNCATADWVGAVSRAGFSFTTAATVLCILAMAPDDRPAEYRSLTCRSATDPMCHRSYPEAVADRIHPWRAPDAAHWLTDDPGGPLVVIPGSGTLPCVEEESRSTGMTLPSCTFTGEDITLAMTDLDAAIALVDADRVNTFYWVWGSWGLDPGEEVVLERFLDAVDERVARGEVRWATSFDQYDAFVAWAATHR